MLSKAVATMLAEPARSEIEEAARILADRLGGDAVLFYGSNLRRNDLEGLVDFYVLHERPMRGLGTVIWPDVGYDEIQLGGATVRAKVAVMSLAQFRRATQGRGVDTTVWARFCQPSRLLYARNEFVAQGVRRGVAAAIMTASRFALALGPSGGRQTIGGLRCFARPTRQNCASSRPPAPARSSTAHPIISTRCCHWRGVPCLWR